MKLFKTPFPTLISYCYDLPVTVARLNCLYAFTTEKAVPIKVNKPKYKSNVIETLDDGTFKHEWYDENGNLFDQIRLPKSVPLRSKLIFNRQSTIKAKFDRNDNVTLYRDNGV